MERCEGEDPDPAEVPPETRLLLAFKTFLSSRKGLLLLAQAVLSFIIFICYIASAPTPLMMVPLLTFLLALCFFVSYSINLNEKFRGIYWLLGDFLCGIIAALFFFAISIASVSQSWDIASNVAGVSFYLTKLAHNILSPSRVNFTNLFGFSFCECNSI
uniref:CKLF like MARVEL transmembrane domain containing 3 n=1 Tax=Laticauda laticaudata TaxID=8630 RepID=A0A8C5SUY7_LATLA